MKFNYHINKNIPQGAWCATLTCGNEQINVELGVSVPHNEQFFVSGVWDDDFDKANFNNCHFACCTGAKLTNSNMGGGNF